MLASGGRKLGNMLPANLKLCASHWGDWDKGKENGLLRDREPGEAEWKGAKSRMSAKSKGSSPPAVIQTLAY